MADRFELIERIAVGGMAEIFRANMIGDAGFSKPVAVKRILPNLAADREFVARFVAEAKIAVTLAHPNIVSVFELSRFGESLYIAMEYVDGPDLATLLSASRRAGAPLPLGPALHVAGELLRGLEHAHEGGVIHRDVSPSNVLLSRAGEVKITDFGIAKARGYELTNNRRVMGKWPYMSPEQASGEPVDHRSDLFSAGAVIYELVCGRRLFFGDSTPEIIDAIRHQPIVPPSRLRPQLPEAIDRALMSMLERDRQRRAPAATAVLAELSDVPLELSRQATAPSLAAQVASLCPPREPVATAPAKLIDDIINSELAHAQNGRRVTVKTERIRGGRETEGLSFVRTDAGGDVGEWLLSDERRTYTLNQTLQLFALPPQPAPEPAGGEPAREAPTVPARPVSADASPTSKLPLILIAASAVVVGLVLVLLLTTRGGETDAIADAGVVAPAPPVSGDAARRATGALLSVLTDPGGASVTLFGEPVGTTPIRDLEIPPRAEVAELVIARDGFQPIHMKVDLAAGAVVRIARDLEPLAANAIDVRSTPRADVFWRGKRIGRTPLRGLELPPGDHQLLLVNRKRNLRAEVAVTVPGDPVIDVTLER